MKIALQLLLSLLVAGVCVRFALQKIDLPATLRVLGDLPLAAALVYAATMITTHLFRAWRWKYLLRPIGVSVPLGRLLTISSVGFMAILALPVRLGEFVRPYYVVRGGQSRMSAVLGTVAVERIVDGLLISILFFACYAAAPAGAYPPVLRGAAWLSLLAFVTLTLFLVFALRWPEQTIRLALAVTLLSWLFPRLSARLSDKLGALIQGFRALRQPKDLFPFLIQTVLYWGSNGLGMWLLARMMNLDIPLVAAYAAMAFTGVLISLPNAPGLVGQFHYGVITAVEAYVPAATVASLGGAYAIALHGIQVAWYVGVGFAALFFAGGGRAQSLREVVVESKAAANHPREAT